MKRNQSGFTLIEIAIVLVIIGLLLGGVLKGQELINSAKVKNLATDFKNVPVFIYGYQDKFKALPGDDKLASTHVATTGITIIDGNGDGLINGNWNAATGESFDFWQHVRLAGLAPGPTTTAATDYIPKNASGGAIGVTSAANTPVTNLRGSYIICSDGVAGKFAKQLDTTLDDGTTTTGSLMVTTAGVSTSTAAIANAAIVDDTTYLVCMGV
ncbi:MAG: prepilin-type N-terminal cleavage/methylation domain-containing protein [Gallionellales bacterium RIFCSPLOWO2_12_FULL_59_22]|nr:MAG: prepilin-type N-terminal cleavage/methylation domain-containing protein [Gallionellales bacterium RIFCSPLOWO2_02_FULL_59_110]OGT04824.1 MAG: prepilin-type N-terminal cleavage/methylation domain-containing protein [Gallionellales bacterium RIFCSPLOWO2_02_58_13]OGT13750.1 MAG: prepilin-type N-terminal cleavage/methylation domain-containing protein [Gallionellales bacterium RIFCSPLOWO2_12_FULL_59_22]